MKSTRFFNLLAVGSVLLVAVVGCRKKPLGVENIPGQRIARVQETDVMPPINPIPQVPQSFDNGTNGQTPVLIPLGPGHEGWNKDAEALAAHVVHFAYDSATLKTSEKSRVAAVADLLKSNPANAVEIEGHCDERGTEEYNRSLGERRALAVREELVRLGIDANRIDTVSFGEDRPANSGHDEAAWSQNRRGEFVLLTAPK